MTSCCPRRRMRWSGATGAIARCKNKSTGCARRCRSVHAWHWICGVMPKPKVGNKPSPHSIVHGLDKPGGFTTVSNIFAFQNVLQATAGYSYAIVNGWDFSGRGMVEFHRRQLQANQAAGNSAGSEPVLGEALNMIGYAFLAQLSALTDFQDHI